MSQAEIIQATSPEDYATGKTLIEEYAAALGVALCFQNFSEEILNLSKHYGPPSSCLLLARSNADIMGCAALRSQGVGVCEMKRLYVRPQFRGQSLGRRLAESAISHAQRLSYSQLVLETLPSMTEAQSLYASLGFREAQHAKPLDGVRYLARTLA